MSSKKDNDIIELSQEAFNDLKEELELKKTKIRMEIADEIRIARELGDLRENQAYSFAMDAKDRNEDRITEIESMLRVAKVVKTSSSVTLVRIGSTVEVENLQDNKIKKVTLMGSEEAGSASPLEGKISIDSPLGAALNNAKVGEVVEIKLPTGVAKYKINKIN